MGSSVEDIRRLFLAFLAEYWEEYEWNGYRFLRDDFTSDDAETATKVIILAEKTGYPAKFLMDALAVFQALFPDAKVMVEYDS